jgi:hypothetical protein
MLCGLFVDYKGEELQSLLETDFSLSSFKKNSDVKNPFFIEFSHTAQCRLSLPAFFQLTLGSKPGASLCKDYISIKWDSQGATFLPQKPSQTDFSRE